MLVKWLRLTADQRHLLVEAVLVLAAVRLGLWLLPFARLQEVLTRWSPHRPPGGRLGMYGVAWAVAAAGRRLPGVSTCLAQALAVQTLLQRRGNPAQLRIGVARDGFGNFQAHAWVECDGRVLSGGPVVDQYTVLHALEHIAA